MRVQIRYTITEVIEEDGDNHYIEGDQTPEKILEAVKEAVAEDCSYVLDGLSKFEIKCELA